MYLGPRRAWRWHDYLLLGGLLVLCAWLHRQPLMDIVGIGLRDEEQSHIFLAPLIALWLLWLRRSRLRQIMLQPNPLGPVIVAGGWLMSWWGFESGVQVAWHAGALVCMIGVIVSMTGLSPLVRLAPVFAALLFMLPIPGEIRHRLALPMQSMATAVTFQLLELMGVSVIRSGNVLTINGEYVAVGEACNGMRMIFALSLVVYAFAFSQPFKPMTRVLLLALSPLVALACNVVRLVPTSIIFGYGDPMFAQSFHDYAGWVMLPVALLILLAVLRAFRWLEFPVTQLRLASQ